MRFIPIAFSATLLAVAFFSFASPAVAQNIDLDDGIAAGFGRNVEEEEPLETDRDAFTRSPRLVAPGRAIVEASYTFLDQGPAEDAELFPDLLVRLGASDLLELRLGWTYEKAKYAHLADPYAEPIEEGIAIYGAKINLTRDCGPLPDSALIISGYTPTSGESNQSDVSLEYAYGWKLQEVWELQGMLRWFSLEEEGDRFQEWAPSIVLKREILCGMGNVHVEYFSLHSNNRAEDYHQHYLGPGIHLLLNPNFEYGVRMFWGLSDDAADFVINAGVGMRR